MEKLTFLEVYLATVVACFALTIAILRSLKPGLTIFLNSLTLDHEISKFFVRLVTLILLLGGFSAGLANGYITDEKANWLTLSWDSVDQVRGTLENIFGVMITLTIVFFILNLINRRFSK
jgi:Na+/alanine symporter